MSRMTRRKPKHTAELDSVRIQYEFIQMLTEHLADCWEVFEGDLTEMMVLAILGQAQIAALQDDKEPINLDFRHRLRGMNASRLSDVSKIPRETVRRKLRQLEKKGWVAQEKEGDWTIAIERGRPKAREALDGLHNRTLERGKRMASALKPLL